MALTQAPAIEGWFTTGPEPALIGVRCRVCGTYAFPPTYTWCPNPSCQSDQIEPAELSRTGKIWSFTDSQYQPPPPYIAQSDPYEPFAIAAVELAKEKMTILGQVANGFGAADLQIGQTVELVLEVLETRDDTEFLVWRWKPVTAEVAS